MIFAAILILIGLALLPGGVALNAYVRSRYPHAALAAAPGSAAMMAGLVLFVCGFVLFSAAMP